MMKIQTSRFGEMEVPEETFITFPSGLVGFPAFQRYVVFDAGEDCAYQWFQAVDEESLALIIVDVHMVDPEFHLKLSDEGLAQLDLGETDSVMILAIVSIPPGNPEQATANLRAPLIINLRTRIGKQVILHESLPLHFPLMPDQPIQEVTEKITETASV